jgi:uncharacterized protein YdeI (BOF family)
MKHPLITFIVCVALLNIIACSKSNNNPKAATPAKDTGFTAALAEGKWVVTNLSQRAEDKTSKLNGFVFTFLSDGKLTISSSSGNVNGTWQFTAAVTYYGSSLKDAISLNCGTSKPLDILSGKWNVISHSSTVIELQNPEILEDEHLRFSKQ